MNLPSIVHSSPAPGHYHSMSPYPPQYTSTPAPPAPPPSPPVEDTKRLPSISTLLMYTEGSSQPAHSAPQERQQSQPPRLPPTPPMRPDSVFSAGSASPTISSSVPASYYYSAYNTAGNRSSYPPAQKPIYPSPTDGYPPQYYPQDVYGKPQMLVPLSVAPPSSSNPWHHHHHQSPTTHQAFPQSQDRYICQTCNKAFSRPSSLRIHSHSHTGEKPFKCPHHGCGKAFSVRSNMKRHERGCHQ
ncbi:hypothetical protein FPQ18DRAFT_94772 [Pyronema domesticum]|uniref:Similar to Zinc finger protein C25B8.19c acc. no. Q9UTA1 n=1 Tax=Pyronema omphalodes (strain CBS 100304) TaxID=1076935 RepID=U4LLV7_PYROM|nr:hypothetical protein FPQ18DRAFT_94772 [Pyronema domesticum]CCX33129.1 Similar to Zinc finger protein C25B8.19c; acc. no. Q9UTA1 [Pyronema omphalodes CBS 100304]